MNTTGDVSFVQEIGLGLLDILLNSIDLTINFAFSLLSALISAFLVDQGLTSFNFF